MSSPVKPQARLTVFENARMQIRPLPDSNHVNIGALAGSFGNVTNSYKFYWILSLLDAVQEHHQRKIAIDWLLSRMVANVWHPVHYFRLQFGKSDKLTKCVESVKSETELGIDAPIADVTSACGQLSKGSHARRLRDELARYVPYRFIRPFFASETQGLKDHEVNPRIAELAVKNYRRALPPMYRFDGDDIEFSDAWFMYLAEHLEVIRGFTYWHLVLYLQSKNPNVGNIASKLTRPVARDLAEGKEFWRLAFKEQVSPRCIYSGIELSSTAFSLDHFLPWSFVAHDALWNLCPTIAEINSAKGDRLPAIDRYLGAFIGSQFDSVKRVAPFCREALLEDYSLLFGVGSRAELLVIDRDDFCTRLENQLRPQFQIATNCGFPPGWVYAAKG